MTLGGAVIGALAGTGVEKALNSKDALEITVNLDNGQTLSVVQELGAEERSFVVGDRVRVLRGGGDSARVRR
jgi:outer membrane lipoprotein SlyB